MNAIEILRLAATTELRPFTKGDWMSFAGCESPDPLIGEVDDYIVLIDGDLIAVINEDGEQFSARVERVEY